MTDSKAYPTMINGVPTMAKRIELFTLIGQWVHITFSAFPLKCLYCQILSFPMTGRSILVLFFGKKDLENISFLMKGTRSELLRRRL